MATVVNQTRVGAPLNVAGGIFSAPLGTALPTDATVTLDEAFKIGGLISEEGLKEAPTRSTDKVKSWGGHLARVLQSEYSITVTFTIIERTEESLKDVFGDANVTSAPGAGGTNRSILKKADQLPIKSRVADMKDGAAKIRLVYPSSQITEVGESQYHHGGLISYPVTVECYPDENGVYGYEYEFVPDAT
ncbi:hypothetical protein [Rothia sp. P5766]|uniref:phage tail tube protein n=1 Tax=unclassified Rothia (in: high G+C Gram-positive bacteria) TaxID=2689056 RepID=UPI003AED8D77